MPCFWIGFNHVSTGLVKVSPRRRLMLELVSLVLMVITWCFTISGIILLSDSGGQQFIRVINYYTGNRSPIKVKGAECASSIPGGCDMDIFQLVGTNIFIGFNIVYTIVTFLLVILNLVYRKEYLKIGQKPQVTNSEWVERKGRQFCCDICSPCNALRMFHHLEHRAAFLINLICAILGVKLYFSIPLTLITFAQTIISYLYAEDVVLCGSGACCIHLMFIRRYPQEDFDTLDMEEKNRRSAEALNV